MSNPHATCHQVARKKTGLGRYTIGNVAEMISNGKTDTEILESYRHNIKADQVAKIRKAFKYS